jgi:2-polyprenyl-3-methyl-5-hydroxy-6-metoxy-1,4-benzoquinol methylase
MKDFWLSTEADNAGDRILTGYRGSLEDMPVSNHLVKLAESGKSALDFGCGVGRNSVALSKNFKKVFAYDLPNMINLVPEKNKTSKIIYTSDWERVKDNKFDVVLASLVFQHIHDQELVDYLKDLSQITEKIILGSRTWIDDTNSSVLDIASKFFDIEVLGETSHEHFTAVLKRK